MARVATVALALFAIPLAAQQPIPADAPFRPNLVPWPVSIEPRGGGLRLGPDVTVTFAGFREGRLDRAVRRYRAAVAHRMPKSEPGPPVPHAHQFGQDRSTPSHVTSCSAGLIQLSHVMSCV